MSLTTSLLFLAFAAGSGAEIDAALSAQVQTELQARLRAQGSSAQVIVDAFRLQALPVGVARVEVGDVAGRWPRGRATVPVRIRVDGQVVRSMSVPIRASDLRKVMVFDTDYAARTGLDAVRLHAADVDMVCCTGATLAQHPSEAYRLRQDVRAGTPLTLDSIERMPEVQSMQNVELLVRRGGIELSTAAVALQDGRLGQRIPVRPGYARESVVAVVTAPGRVQIHD